MLTAARAMACALLAGAATAQPVFPDGAGAIIGGVAAQQRATPALHDLAASILREELNEAAYTMAHVRILQRVFAGGCPRDVTKCPREWDRTASGACSPPSDYDGWCGDVDARDMSPAEIEAFSWKCKASWPCAAPCKLDFGSCPVAWRSQGSGACAAPAEYNGMCRRAADFSNQTASQKASWAAMCDVAWLAFALGASRSRIAIRMRCFAGRARE
ncbi:unnamed protein product, partial [Prorocentrum cordatum]